MHCGKGTDKNDQRRVADLQQNAFDKKVLFVDVLNRSVGILFVFNVCESNGEGFSAKLLVSEVQQKRMPNTRMAPYSVSDVAMTTPKPVTETNPTTSVPEATPAMPG